MAETRVMSVLVEVLSTGGQNQARGSSVVAEVLVSIAEADSEVPVSTGTAPTTSQSALIVTMLGA
jgi:hypothetical protein